MYGDKQDFISRLQSMLPRGWIAESAPLSQALLGAIGAAFQSTLTLISAVRLAARTSTASGGFLDLASTDFFGSSLPRRSGETDSFFRVRVLQELLRDRTTRSAVAAAIEELTGKPPFIVEPARPADTGGYAQGGVGFGVAGAWGNLQLKNCCFVTAYRPASYGIAELAGYATGGTLAYGSMGWVTPVASDAEILATVAAVMPTGTIAWTRISG